MNRPKQMRIAELDLENGTAYIWEGDPIAVAVDPPIVRSKADDAQVTIDYDIGGNVVGIEVLFPPVIGGVVVE